MKKNLNDLQNMINSFFGVHGPHKKEIPINKWNLYIYILVNFLFNSVKFRLMNILNVSPIQIGISLYRNG